MKYSTLIILLLLIFVSQSNAQSFGGKSKKSKSVKVYSPPRAKTSVINSQTRQADSKNYKVSPKKSKGIISKVKDDATRGFGWQLGKEAAKETIKGIKKAAPIVKEKAIELKEKISK